MLTSCPDIALSMFTHLQFMSENDNSHPGLGAEEICITVVLGLTRDYLDSRLIHCNTPSFVSRTRLDWKRKQVCFPSMTTSRNVCEK